MENEPSPLSIVTVENFESLVADDGPYLLDFWASWCVPCMLMKKGVAKAAESLRGIVTVGLVNVDEQPELVNRFAVQGTPMFILMRGDQVLATFAGLRTANGLVQLVRERLELDGKSTNVPA